MSVSRNFDGNQNKHLSNAQNIKKHSSKTTGVSKDTSNNIAELTFDLDGIDLSCIEYEDGLVISVMDGVISASGLSNAFVEEKVEIISSRDKTKVSGVGMILNLEEARVGIVLVTGTAEEGDQVVRTKQRFQIKVGEGVLGRVLNGEGKPIDGLGEISGTTQELPIERDAASITQRQSVHEPMYTGLKIIDGLIPIGRGQRELIIGDRQTGKSTIAIDTILNQRNNIDGPVYCIYVFIGQRQDEVTRLHAKLKAKGAMEYCTIVSASSSDSSMMQYLAPYVGTAIGEYFMYKGKHALIIYDDLSKHANAYREISLLLKRPPSREAYPGDIFYIHSRLLERSAKLNAKYGGGSLTALPLVETKAGDVSGYVPTNVISITDGQIFLDVDLFNKNIKPAINIGISVSRIGSSAQTAVVKQLVGMLKIKLAQYYEMAEFAQFGSELDASTQALLNNGKKIVAAICQKQDSTLKIEYQVIMIFMAVHGYLDNVPESQIAGLEQKLIEHFEYSSQESALFSHIKSGKKLSNEQLKELQSFCEQFVSQNYTTK